MAAIITEESVIQNNISQYLKCFEKENGKFKCLVEECGQKLSDKSVAIRHLKSKHPNIVKSIDSAKATKKPECIEIKSRIIPTHFWNAILQLMIFNALPFAILKSQGFRYLIKPYIAAFEQAGIQCTVDSRNVQHLVRDTANQIKEKISIEVKGKMICLLLDIASRYNHSIFGINIMYWSNGKPCIKTIGMEALKISQTGKNLYGLVKEKLAEFGIDLKQIFSVTTDNGKNLLKMIKLIRKDLAKKNNGSSDGMSSDESGGEEYGDEDDDDNNENAPAYDLQNDEIFDPELFNVEYFEDLLSNLRNEFDCSYNSLFIGISCAAHGLHLVVKDAINHCDGIKELIEKFRSLAKKLRTPKLRAELIMKNKTMALIDVKTRWSSTYNMVRFINRNN